MVPGVVVLVKHRDSKRVSYDIKGCFPCTRFIPLLPCAHRDRQLSGGWRGTRAEITGIITQELERGKCYCLQSELSAEIESQPRAWKQSLMCYWVSRGDDFGNDFKHFSLELKSNSGLQLHQMFEVLATSGIFLLWLLFSLKAQCVSVALCYSFMCLRGKGPW